MKGQGNLIAYVMISLIVVVSAIFVINMINKTQSDSADYLMLEQAKNTLTELNTIITELAFEAPGSRRKITLQILSISFLVN